MNKKGEGDNIGELLIKNNLITKGQLNEALEEQHKSNESLEKILIKKGLVTREELNSVTIKEEETSTIDLTAQIIEPEVLSTVPQDFARKHTVIPVSKTDQSLTVALLDPTDVYVLDALGSITGLSIRPLKASELEIQRAIDQYYGASGSLQELIGSIDEKEVAKGDAKSEMPIARIVDLLITEATRGGASDIHLEPEEKFLGIRYRIDGVLHSRINVPKFLQPSVISRIKVMSNLDIAERRVPQDGRIQTKVGTREIDIRVSTQPTIFGENVVMRLLDKTKIASIRLEELGFSPDLLKKFENLITRPHGILLVTGPTGSGKTTTLYACLKRLNKEDVNIMTMEDPIEYQLERIRQTQVNVAQGMTFARGMRAILRQDPDIILVGEIRDLETAEIAVQAALTGHYVFSTLHTNDAAGAFTRLVDMGVEPFLISSCVIGTMAQRLVRTLCSVCKEAYNPSEVLIEQLGLSKKVDKNIVFYRAKGCKNCGDTGYRGRVAIFEILPISPTIQELVVKRVSSFEIKQQALREGMITLYNDALDKVLAGVTSVEEMLRVTAIEEK